MIKVHSLFSMLQLNHTYVTSIGKLIGVVALKDVSACHSQLLFRLTVTRGTQIRVALEKMNSGTFQGDKSKRFHVPPTHSDSVGETSISLSVFDADHEALSKFLPSTGDKTPV